MNVIGGKAQTRRLFVFSLITGMQVSVYECHSFYCFFWTFHKIEISMFLTIVSAVSEQLLCVNMWNKYLSEKQRLEKLRVSKIVAKFRTFGHVVDNYKKWDPGNTFVFNNKMFYRFLSQEFSQLMMNRCFLLQ